ncbi:response regulator [Sediminicola arcticus]|jgi:CRP-like cAMP-binding protein|uniref:Response regulator n=1 Tax=Sediminicola arcticus TaxID=1574308 RepID=A0ABV2SRX3_9FLAO
MKTVLLIEDDLALRENTQELLELASYNVITAPNGKLGIQYALNNMPDIVVCDIMMPEIDGYGVLEALTSNEKTNQIPFIFLSAKTEHKEIRKGMDLGADDYLTKPFEEEDLFSAIESRLAKAQILAQIEHKKNKNLSDDEHELRNLNELKNFFDDKGELYFFKNGETIYKEGDHSNKIYLSLKGAVKCYKMDSDGKELVTSLHPADDFLGFTSFLDNMPYEESAVAVEDVELVGVSKDYLKSILQKNNQVSLELMGLLSKNLSEIKQQLLQMAYSSVRKKTAQTLMQFANLLNKSGDKPIKVSRSDLASVAGIATESLIRTLSSFKKEGIIDIEGRNIKILDLNLLQQMN